jgi:tetratricopeptide (TPR) repeat protein
MMNSAYLAFSSPSLPVADQPEIQAFFADLLRVTPTIVEDASEADLSSLHRMGVACRLCGQFELAENFYRKALQIAEAKFGGNSSEAATHRNFLAGLYFMWGRFELCVPLIERSLGVYKVAFGPEHIYTRLTHFALALAYSGWGNEKRSREHYELSDLRSQSHGEAQSQDRWSSLSAKLAALSAMKYEQGHFNEAVELFRHCVIHEANEAWPGSMVVAKSLNGLAVLCRSQALDAEAEEFFKMTLAMKKDICGEAHPEYKMTQKQHQDLLDEQAKRQR